jgi:hypothetical protein
MGDQAVFSRWHRERCRVLYNDFSGCAETVRETVCCIIIDDPRRSGARRAAFERSGSSLCDIDHHAALLVRRNVSRSAASALVPCSAVESDGPLDTDR